LLGGVGFDTETRRGPFQARQHEQDGADQHQGRRLRNRRRVHFHAAFLRRAGEWILQLYTNWGKPEKVAEWRKELETAAPSAPGVKN
jgi:hypothetical protein